MWDFYIKKRIFEVVAIGDLEYIIRGNTYNNFECTP